MNLSESYKNRIKKLAGILKEEISVNSTGDIFGIAPPGQIPGDKEFLYSVTYQIITPESAEQGDYDSQGWEEEETSATLDEIINIGRHNYGVSEHSGNNSWSSTSPEANRSYFEKGESKTYSLFIKNLDNTELSNEDENFINELFKNPRMKWDDIDNMWR